MLNKKILLLGGLLATAISPYSNAAEITALNTIKEDAKSSISKIQEESKWGDVTIGGGVGSTGFTGELGYRNKNASTRIGRHIGLRFNYNQYDDVMTDVEIDGEEFKEISLNTKSKGVITDLYLFNETPILKNIRFSGGYYWGDLNGNAVYSAENLSDATVEIGGTTYSLDASSKIDGAIDYDLTGPYLGLGIAGEIFAGLGITFDIGLIMLNDEAADVNLVGTGTANSGAVDLSSDATFLAAVAQEESNIQEDLPEDFYPVVRLGLSYRF